MIAFYNDVELSCEHLAMFQLKTLNHIFNIMYYLQKTRLKISESDCDLEHEKSTQESRLCSVHLQQESRFCSVHFQYCWLSWLSREASIAFLRTYSSAHVLTFSTKSARLKLISAFGLLISSSNLLLNTESLRSSLWLSCQPWLHHLQTRWQVWV